MDGEARGEGGMTPTENKAIVARFIAMMSAGDTPGLLGLYTEDGRVVTMGNTLISGSFDRAQIAAAAARVFDVFPAGIRFVVHAMTADEDRVAVEAESFARHVSGADYNNKYHFLFRLRGGRVAELKEYCDTEHITDVICGGARPETAAS